MNPLTEKHFENVAVSSFAATSTAHRRGVELDVCGELANASVMVLSTLAKAALRNLNSNISVPGIDAVVASLSRPPHPTLIEINRWFHGLLTDGVLVECKDSKNVEMRGARVEYVSPAISESGLNQ